LSQKIQLIHGLLATLLSSLLGFKSNVCLHQEKALATLAVANYITTAAYVNASKNRTL